MVFILVYSFLKSEGQKYNFFPVIDDLESFADLYIDNCYVLKSGKEIVGFTALWNQENYKQFVVKILIYKIIKWKTLKYVQIGKIVK